jgi:hypothetical protein
MVILHRQQIGLPGFEPALGRAGLTLGAVPVAARVVGDVLMIASGAAKDMTTQCRGATLFDGGHDFQLTQAQVVMLSISPSGPAAAEDIRHLERKPSHEFSL